MALEGYVLDRDVSLCAHTWLSVDTSLHAKKFFVRMFEHSLSGYVTMHCVVVIAFCISRLNLCVCVCVHVCICLLRFHAVARIQSTQPTHVLLKYSTGNERDYIGLSKSDYNICLSQIR